MGAKIIVIAVFAVWLGVLLAIISIDRRVRLIESKIDLIERKIKEIYKKS